MGRDGSQSPEQLLPDRTNRSDRNTECNRRYSVHIPNPDRNCSFNVSSNQPPPPQQPQLQTSWVGSLSPIHRTSSPSTSSAATANGIPLYPCLPLPYNCHHDNHNTNHHHHNNNNSSESSSVGGIMPLTNFSFGRNNKDEGNTPPPKKSTFNIQSPQIAPISTGFDDTLTPTCHPQTPPEQCVALYHLTHKLQWLIPIVLMIQSIIFVITMYENDCPHTYFNPKRCVLRFLSRLAFQPMNENPLLGPSYKTLLSVGALNSHLVTSSGQGWRLLTALWLHAGMFHLLANMLGLLSIGRRLERKFGCIKVAAIYLLAGFGGSLLSALFLQNQVSVGASGALMGLLGATIAEMLINWSTDPTTNNKRSKLLVVLLLTLIINLTFGLMPHVDNFAHIGGLCAGPLLGLILLMQPRSATCVIGHGAIGGEVQTMTLPKHSSMQNTARFVALGLLVFAYAMGMLTLFKGYGWDSRRSCRWCKYMSCVPSFPWKCQSV